MNNVQIHIVSPSPRPIFAEEVNLLLAIMPSSLVALIESLGADAADTDTSPAAGATSCCKEQQELL